MKKLQIIILMSIFSVILIFNISFTKMIQNASSISLIGLKTNQAFAEDTYGNGMTGNGYDCILGEDENGNTIHGVMIVCWSRDNSLCIATKCGGGIL
jgi:hypothetical protein